MLKNPPANAGDTKDVGLIPDLGRSPGEGNGDPRQHSCLENSMDRGVWWTTVHGVAKSWTHRSVHTHSPGAERKAENRFFPEPSEDPGSADTLIAGLQPPVL